MIRIRLDLLLLSVALSLSAFAAPREKAAAPSVRPLAVSAEAKAALLLSAFSLACAFHSSCSANWMIDNTMSRLVWYVSVVPLFEISLEPERRF